MMKRKIRDIRGTRPEHKPARCIDHINLFNMQHRTAGAQSVVNSWADHWRTKIFSQM
jgi:hypothetical protein